MATNGRPVGSPRTREGESESRQVHLHKLSSIFVAFGPQSIAFTILLICPNTNSFMLPLECRDITREGGCWGRTIGRQRPETSNGSQLAHYTNTTTVNHNDERQMHYQLLLFVFVILSLCGTEDIQRLACLRLDIIHTFSNTTRKCRSSFFLVIMLHSNYFTMARSAKGARLVDQTTSPSAGIQGIYPSIYLHPQKFIPRDSQFTQMSLAASLMAQKPFTIFNDILKGSF